jgi:hypothetical protein
MNKTQCETKGCIGEILWGSGKGYVTDKGTTRVCRCPVCGASHRRPVDGNSPTQPLGPAVITGAWKGAPPRLIKILDEKCCKR